MTNCFLRLAIILSVFVSSFTFTKSPQAQSIKTITFSAAEGYSNGPLEGQPSGGDVWTNGSASALTSRFEVQDGQLVITENADDNQWIYILIPVQQGVFTASWDWQYIGAPDSVVDFGVTLSDTVNFDINNNGSADFNECGAMIRMNTDPDLDVRNGDLNGGGSYATDVPYDYRDGAEIHMRVEVDAEALAFDVYATKGGVETQIASDYGFRRITSEETNGLNCILMWSNGDTPGNQIIVDNFVLAGPAPVQEWTLY